MTNEQEFRFARLQLAVSFVNHHIPYYGSKPLVKDAAFNDDETMMDEVPANVQDRLARALMTTLEHIEREFDPSVSLSCSSPIKISKGPEV